MKIIKILFNPIGKIALFDPIVFMLLFRKKRIVILERFFTKNITLYKGRNYDTSSSSSSSDSDSSSSSSGSDSDENQAKKLMDEDENDIKNNYYTPEEYKLLQDEWKSVSDKFFKSQ